MFYLGNKLSIIAFPTKYNWRDKSSIKLIEESTYRLYDMTNKYGWKSVFLPAPG